MTSTNKQRIGRIEVSSAHLADLFDDHMSELIEAWHDDTPPPPELEEQCQIDAEAALGQIDSEVWTVRGKWLEPSDRRLMTVTLVIEHKGTEILRRVRWSPFEKIWLMRTERGAYTRFA